MRAEDICLQACLSTEWVAQPARSFIELPLLCMMFGPDVVSGCLQLGGCFGSYP